MQDIQYIAEVSCDQMFMEYTQDKYGDIPLTLGTCSTHSRDVTATWEYTLRYPGRHHPDAIVLQQLEQHCCETGSVISMAYMTAVHPQTTDTSNEDAITAAVEKVTMSHKNWDCPK
jgi:hypothetical protein